MNTNIYRQKAPRLFGTLVACLVLIPWLPGCGSRSDQSYHRSRYQQPEPESSQVVEEAAKVQEAAIEAQKTSYPLGVCVVCRKHLGELGDPVDYVHEGNLVRLCCEHCLPDFRKDPGSFVAKVDAALAQAAAFPQLASPEAPQASSNVKRLDRSNLLQYRDPQGKIRAVTTIEDWQHRRKEILEGMQEVMGPLPQIQDPAPLNLQILEEVDCGSFVRRLIRYNSEPGSNVPAYLLIPTKALNEGVIVSGILCLHPTDNQVGHKVVVGLSNKPNRNYAEELAERGFVTLAPSYPLLANYQPDLEKLGYQSGTMKAVWDNMRGIDLLESLPFVKKEAFATIGHSLGGHNSIYTAVFDQRIKVIVSSCGFDSFLDYMDGNIKGWTSTRYMPNLLKFDLEAIPFDFHELIAALAPRAFFASAPIGDTNFKWRSVDKIATAASQIYDLYNAGSNLMIQHPDCGHDFPREMRELAYQLIEKHLQ